MGASIFNSWLVKMAWRDSRSSRRRLLLFSTSIVLGVAALVAITSSSVSLKRAIEDQSKALLGADLEVHSRDPFTPEAEQLFQEMGGEQAREVTFSSMVYFPRTEGTRLVQVRALGGEFPYYGQFETTPPGAGLSFRHGTNALVEESLMNQFGARVGDPARIGELTLRIAATLHKVPGETVAFSTIAPRVYIPLAELERTKLVREDSFARYKMFFKFDAPTDVNQVLDRYRPRLRKLKLGWDTVEERKADLGKAMENLHRFLNLGGFVALLLGGIGVGSAAYVHVKQKLGTVAVLRCLGATGPQTFLIYLLQGAALGAIGAVGGVMLGLGVQLLLPRVLQDFVPFPLVMSISWLAVGRAAGMGFCICLLFTLFPLLSVRRVPPLPAIRSSYESISLAKRDPLEWLLCALIGATILGFAIMQTERRAHGVGFALSVAGAFLLLALVARFIMLVARYAVKPFLPYVWRQGLASLYRPQNRTHLMLLALGLATFLVLTMYLVQKTLLTELLPRQRQAQANAVLFDVQSDQRQAVTNLLRSQNLPLLQSVPIVTMRLTEVKGRKTSELLKDPRRTTPGWALRREYRSTYRDFLVESEQSSAGVWPAQPLANEIIPISVEAGIAAELKAGLGDELAFDVQGVPFRCRIVHLRKVEWRRVQPNFFVVFPPGVLEEAPAFHVITTRVESGEASARMQRAVVKQFPNISTIDLTLILQTVDAIVTKISYVIRFMASFTILTGLLVLAGAILTGRYQRIQESILLRTLGATSAQVGRILVIEYFLLGLFASMTGMALAIAASWGLAHFVFKTPFTFPLLPLCASALAVSAITVILGLLMSRGIMNHPPLEVLRAEAN